MILIFEYSGGGENVKHIIFARILNKQTCRL